MSKENYKEDYKENKILSTSFKDYKQETWQGACELYSFIWGCLHTSMRHQLLENIREIDNGYAIKFEAVNAIIEVKNQEINAVLSSKSKSEEKEYNPSNNRGLIAIGLAYAKVMKKYLDSPLELVGAKEGYLIDRAGMNHKTCSKSGDLLLGIEINYISQKNQLILKTDGSVLECHENNNYKKIGYDKNDLFIIYPHWNHAILYYYEQGAWKRFDNQEQITTCKNEDIKLQSKGKSRIRLIVNNEFLEYKLTSQQITHEELIDKFVYCLKVNKEDVLNGIVVEQQLVKEAEIDQKQQGALFRPHSPTITFFDLKLNADQCIQFINYYEKKFPHLIQGVSARGGEESFLKKIRYPLKKGYVRFFMKTHCLYNEVSQEWYKTYHGKQNELLNDSQLPDLGLGCDII